MDYRNAFDLTGSVAVISGGSRGIGYESAVALGSCGAKVVLASRDPGALNTAVKRLARTGINAACAVVDVTDPNAVAKVADAIRRNTARWMFSSTAQASPDSIQPSKRPMTNGAR
jgi:NAD(P)-dependent dehydrogenase (short-subunit alcohol dehydrogenase family)